jgi:arylsulfatase A-like enzyme
MRQLILCVPSTKLPKCLLALLIAFSASVNGANPNDLDYGRPNFVIISVDDLGYGDVGSYRAFYPGRETGAMAYRYTSEIDQLASEGIIATRAYSAPWGAGGRQMLHSGAWINRRAAIAPDFKWIGSRLRQAGYTTGMFGNVEFQRETNRLVQYHGPERTEFDQGLFYVGTISSYHLKAGQKLHFRHGQDASEVPVQNGDYLNDHFTRAAVAFIREQSEKPFFLHVAYAHSRHPHRGKAEDLRKLFPGVFAALADEAILASQAPEDISSEAWDRYHHAAALYAIDRGLGEIRRELEALGVADNTFVFFVSSNGSLHGSNYPLTGKKWDIYEGGIRVPLIVWGGSIANSKHAGSIYDRLITIADIAPTIAAAAGSSPVADFDGDNILPYLLGQKDAPARIFYYRNETQNYHVSGGGDLFTDNKEPILLETFIREQEKFMRFGGWNHSQTFEQYVSLPCVRDQSNPSVLLSEDIQKTPAGASTALETVRRDQLHQHHRAFLQENEDNFSLGWSDRGGGL